MSEVLVERDQSILIVRINRPQVRNAISRSVAVAIDAAMDELEQDPSLSVGILTGTGGFFCSGMDLKAFAATGERPHTATRGFGGLAKRPPSKPLIAAVEGFALAGGFELALACDMVVAARGATFGIPEVKRGLVAAAGGLVRLPAVLPRPIIMELALTGDPMLAERAAELGLVNLLSDPGEALDVAVSLAQRVARNAPLALAVSKEIVLHAGTWSPDESWDRLSALADPVLQSSDAREGATAFAEKRAPQWSRL